MLLVPVLYVPCTHDPLPQSSITTLIKIRLRNLVMFTSQLLAFHDAFFLEAVRLLCSKATLRSQPLTIEEEDENATNTQRRESGKQTHTPSDSQVQEHRTREQDGCRCKRRSCSVVTRKQTSSIRRIDHRQINKHTLEQDEHANHIDNNTNTTDDPVDLTIASPCEDEEADGDEETGEQGWDQSTFGGAQAMCSDLRFDDVVEICVVSCNRDDDADSNAEEYKAHLSDVETVSGDVD
jgi:hypothetical protein